MPCVFVISEVNILHGRPARSQRSAAKCHQEPGQQQTAGHCSGSMCSCWDAGPLWCTCHTLTAGCFAPAGSAAEHTGAEGFDEGGAGRCWAGNSAEGGRNATGQDEKRRVQIPPVWGLQVLCCVYIIFISCLSQHAVGNKWRVTTLFHLIQSWRQQSCVIIHLLFFSESCQQITDKLT